MMQAMACRAVMPFILLVLALLIGLGGSVRAQDEAITSATPDIVRMLRNDILRDRTEAESQLDRARQWRALQASQVRAAERDSSEAGKKAALDFAQLYDRYARDLEAYAQKLRDQANAAEARANRLDGALKKQQEATRPAAPVVSPAPPTAPPVPTAPAAGTSPVRTTTAPTAPSSDSDDSRNPAAWLAGRYQRDPMVETYPQVEISMEGDDKVKLAALHDDWTGSFTPPTDSANGKLVFTRKPAAGEMGAKAPLWARQPVAGKLEWRLELEVFECPEVQLVGKWYPGELRWSDRGGKREASVAGPGEPVAYALKPIETQAEQWADVADGPIVIIASASAPLARGGLRSVTKKRPFMPVVRASIDWARARGDTIKVSLRARTSGRTAEVELVRFGSANSVPVLYMPREAVVIDDHSAAPLLIGTPLSVPLSQETVRFDVANGEVVTAEVESGAASFIVYDTWVQQGIANHRRNFEQLYSLFQATLGDSVSTRETREIALQKSRLIQNFETLLAYKPQGNENFTDYTRFEIGQAYAELLARFGQPDREGRTATPLHGPPPDKHGVVYTTDFERRAVGDAMAAGYQRYRDGLALMGTELLIGTYEFFAEMTGAAQFVAAVWAIDPHGNPVNATDRVFAGIGLGSQLLLVGALTARQVSKLSTETKLQGAWAELLEQDMIAAQQRMAGIETAEARAAGGAASGGARRASPRPGNTSPALGPGKAANMAENLAEQKLDRMLGDAYKPRGLSGRNSTAWDPLYDGDHTFEVPVEVAPLNSKGTPMQINRHGCGLAAAEGGMRDAGFTAVTEMENAQAAMKARNFGDLAVLDDAARFENGGMTARQLGRHLGSHGAKVRVARDARRTAMLGPLVQGVKQGKQYYILINNGSRAEPSWHWVRFEGMTCSQNKPWVHIGDPWRGASFKMPPRMFTARVLAIVEADWTDLLIEMHGTAR